MYEISLVPDVKEELIKKLKLRNLVILICIIVTASCVGIFMLLLGVTTGQGLTLSALDEEMACRSEGSIPKSTKACNTGKYGTAIMQYENGKELLTIQDQMKNLSLLNNNKIKFSRLFYILASVLPSMEYGDENTVKVSEISADIMNSSISFDGLGYSSTNVGYHALESFMKNASRTYYDYGNYMRYDTTTGEYVVIPSFCITEELKDGVYYGVYHQGAPGCEAPMIEKSSEEISGNTGESEDAENTLNNSIATIGSIDADINDIVSPLIENNVKDIYIRRIYNDEADLEDYKNGKDRYAAEGAEKIRGYYFQSECLKYNNGKYDEKSTLEACPLLSSEVTISDSSYGRDADDNMVLSFSAILDITPDVFLSGNKHMMIGSPSRQIVTDSYLQVNGMFTENAHDTEEE